MSLQAVLFPGQEKAWECDMQCLTITVAAETCLVQSFVITVESELCSVYFENQDRYMEHLRSLVASSGLGSPAVPCLSTQQRTGMYALACPHLLRAVRVLGTAKHVGLS